MTTPDRSTKPYLIRAIHEWCSEGNFTPYLSVKVDAGTRVPMEYVKDGQIVLNLSYGAVKRLSMGNDLIQFSARFSGVSRECSIPVPAVIGIFARENGQGLFFPPETAATETGGPGVDQVVPDPSAPRGGGKPRLQLIK